MCKMLKSPLAFPRPVLILEQNLICHNRILVVCPTFCIYFMCLWLHVCSLQVPWPWPKRQGVCLKHTWVPNWKLAYRTNQLSDPPFDSFCFRAITLMIRFGGEEWSSCRLLILRFWVNWVYCGECYRNKLRDYFNVEMMALRPNDVCIQSKLNFILSCWLDRDLKIRPIPIIYKSLQPGNPFWSPKKHLKLLATTFFLSISHIYYTLIPHSDFYQSEGLSFG